MEFSPLPCNTSSKHGAPYETKSGKFFRPAQTDLQKITGEYLQENAQGHKG
jgi:hypothetical protein